LMIHRLAEALGVYPAQLFEEGSLEMETPR